MGNRGSKRGKDSKSALHHRKECYLTQESEEQESTAAAASLRTATIEELCPSSLEASLLVWSAEEFYAQDRFTDSPPQRFALSVPTSLCDGLHVFVSHVWKDVVFERMEKALRCDQSKRSCYGSSTGSLPAYSTIKPMDVFYDLKATALKKGMAQLHLRRPGDLPQDVRLWRVWVDLACVNQNSAEHKAHITELLGTYIRKAKTMVVILSQAYFSRLWCMYECCWFLATHSVLSVAVYCWAFQDRMKAPLERMDNCPPEILVYGDAIVDSLRNFSVAQAQCTFECDRQILSAKILELYRSTGAFERFVKFTGVTLTTWGLLLSPAIYDQRRYEQQFVPWIVAARELGFPELAGALQKFDGVDIYRQVAAVRPPEKDTNYSATVQAFFAEHIVPLVQKERNRAMRAGENVD